MIMYNLTQPILPYSFLVSEHSIRAVRESVMLFTDKSPSPLLPYSYLFSEHSIAAARASVMLYDDSLKKWVPSGASTGLSKVHIYHHSVNNTFRVVGRKIQDHEVSGQNSNKRRRKIRLDNIYRIAFSKSEYRFQMDRPTMPLTTEIC